MSTVNSYLHEFAYKSRLWLGQIVDIKEEDGTATVKVIGQNPGAADQDLIIPCAVSIPNANGTKSSWQRYMPQKHDYVKLTYRTDGHAEIVCMAMYGGIKEKEKKSAQGQTYAVLKEMNASKNYFGLRDFRPLKQGEWDMRSSGGAYIFGSNKGRLILRSGMSQISVERQQDEIRQVTGLLKLKTTNSELRFGNVKRTSASDPLKEEGKPENAPGQEFSVSLVAAALVPLPIYEHKAGNVYDSLGIEVMSSTGKSLRSQTIAYDDTGVIEVLKTTVDSVGNTSVTQGPNSTNFDIIGGTGSELSSTFNTVAITGTTSVDISSASITLKTAASGVPTEGVILGNTFFDNMQQCISKLSAAIAIAATSTQYSVGAAGPNAAAQIGEAMVAFQAAKLSVSSTVKVSL
jgi:hypothetical protein